MKRMSTSGNPYIIANDSSTWSKWDLHIHTPETKLSNNYVVTNGEDAWDKFKDCLVTAADCKNYRSKHYNLDAIIAVGYRINTKRATAFRQWATAVLRDYALRGYAIDRKRMENGAFLDEDYFEHLLAEIREIRLSERRFYQKITDIYATARNSLKPKKVGFKNCEYLLSAIELYVFLQL
jgi:hypothetical protein